MKAIIPVAGVGTRLKPFTTTVPKPLLPVAGKPILAHLMDNLLSLGVDRFEMVIGYMGDKIRDFVEANYPGKADFFEQDKLLGLGYAVKIGLQSCDNEPVIVALGDTIIEVDFRDLTEKGKNIVGIHEVENPRRFGVVELDGDRIIGMEEKPQVPKSNMAIAGFYIFQNSDTISNALGKIVEKGIKTRGEYQLTDAMKLMIEDGVELYAANISGWFDCGTVGTLIETNRHLLEKSNAPEPRDSVVFIPPVYIGSSVKIVRSVIGPNVSVGDNAYICDSIIADSILGDRATVEHAHLRESVLGNESTFCGRWAKMILGDHSEGGFYNSDQKK
jgi:glucose-1-phosphate thymidylyltransferase